MLAEVFPVGERQPAGTEDGVISVCEVGLILPVYQHHIPGTRGAWVSFHSVRDLNRIQQPVRDYLETEMNYINRYTRLQTVW